MQVLERNREGLREEPWGVKNPHMLKKQLKELEPDETITLPDGTHVRGSDVLGPPRRGRKVRRRRFPRRDTPSHPPLT